MKKKAFLKNSKKLLAVILALVCLVLLCSSCKNAEHLELTPEETHRFCETYGEDVVFWKGATHGVQGSIAPLKNAFRASYSLKNPLCLFEVTEVKENEPYLAEDCYRVVVQIKKVYHGDTAYEGAESHHDIIGEKEALTRCIGKKYLGWVQPNVTTGLPRSAVYHRWVFLVTEGNRLVSPFGCQVEAAQAEAGTIQNTGPMDNYSIWEQECREYTGQTLEYFVEKVKSLEEEYLKEEAEKSGTE